MDISLYFNNNNVQAKGSSFGTRAYIPRTTQNKNLNTVTQTQGWLYSCLDNFHSRRQRESTVVSSTETVVEIEFFLQKENYTES